MKKQTTQEAKLSKALLAMYQHFAIDDEDNDFWHPGAVRACKLAREALGLPKRK